MNTEVPLINLTTKNRTIIAYACSHAVIIYNYESKEAMTLQAHQSTVRTLSISRDGKWLLSADFESDPVVVIWDTESGVPICTLFNPHGDDELAAARISPNAKYIVTVGNERHQKVQFWLWTYGKDEPNTSIELTEIAFDRVKEIAFNEDFPEEFALTADHNIVFLIWAQDKLKYNCPKVVGNIRRYGIFNSSCYVSGTQQAVTATANGYVLVWTTVMEKGRGNVRDVEMKYVKSIQLQKYSINVILQHDGMLVTGTADGRINFHDPQLKILYWCQNRHLDSIQSISFNLQSTLLGPVSTTVASDLECDEEDLNYKGEFEENSESKIESTICDEGIEYLKQLESKLLQHQDEVTSATTINLEYMLRDYDKKGSSAKPPHIPVDATSENAPFYVDNFFVGSSTGVIALIKISTLKCQFFSENVNAAITSLDTHPRSDYIVTGNIHGLICLYDYKKRKLITNKKTPTLPDFRSILDKQVKDHNIVYVTCPRSHDRLSAISTLKYSPIGKHFFN
ncbi:cilia- and flagella-associated protein 251-like [Colletes gigas]|uniref:cilia- and flagella-associated protein 251-like n=1 Tax=Colletes gigas TaxID=935657 RepID=UPI001C9B3C38|nr:cilia- and flagella-associated protein 251-like [Colletes gigas]